MVKLAGAIIKYPEIGVCGLSCRLCPRYQSKSASRCRGCKSEERMGAGCPLVTCAAKKGGIEFCWDCTEADTCTVWAEHRESGRTRDTFKCYRTMEDDIAFVRRHGAREFEREQKKRERLLVSMLEEFNEGRSMSYYCVAATILPENGLRGALARARRESKGMDLKSRAKVLHGELDRLAEEMNTSIKMRR